MHKIKFYLIGLLFFIGSNIGRAQEEQKVRLSLTVNPNINWLSTSNDGYNSEGIKMGITYGLLTDFRLFGVNNYSLSTGFTFSHIGGKISSPDVYNDNGTFIPAQKSSNYKFTNIDVPMVIRLKTNEIGYNVFYAVFGTELGFNINAQNKYTLTYGNSTTAEETNDISYGTRDKDSGEEYANWFRTSLVFGLGIQRSISGKTAYRIGLTYHNGLTNMFGGKTYLTDNNNQVILDGNGNPTRDRALSTKQQFVELHLSIVF